MGKSESAIFGRAAPIFFRAVTLCLGIAVGNTSAFAGDVAASAVAKTEQAAVVGADQPAGATKKRIKPAKSKKSRKAKSEPIFATVNGKPIAMREYNASYDAELKRRFYHGQVPEGQAEVVSKEVGDELINRELLVKEAERRRFVPDPAKFERVLADYDARYGAEPDWPQRREQFLPQLKVQVARHSMVEQLEGVILNVPPPALEDVRAYFEGKPELFTEPDKPRLSVILLKVDPSSPQEAWDKAREEAQGIYDRIKDGADFANEAHLHSKHASAANGGDMGYLHGGMLSEGLERRLEKLEVGELSEPIKMLEGFALYRVEERVPGKLQEFSAVENRARELLERDLKTRAWVDTLSRLRAAAKIKYFAAAASTGKLPQKK